MKCSKIIIFTLILIKCVLTLPPPHSTTEQDVMGGNNSADYNLRIKRDDNDLGLDESEYEYEASGEEASGEEPIGMYDKRLVPEYLYEVDA